MVNPHQPPRIMNCSNNSAADDAELRLQVPLPDPTEPIPVPYQVPIPDLIREHACCIGNHIAILQDSRSWTYQQLDLAARTLADALLQKGVATGTVVAVMGERSFGLIASLLAVLSSGGVLLALDPKLPPTRLRTMLTESGVIGAVVVGPNTGPFNSVETLGFQIHVEADSARVLDHEKSVSKTPHAVLPSLAPEQSAYIFFTSGTTGIPKGVLGTHGGLSHFLCWQRETFSVSQGDRVAQTTNLSFDVMLRDIFLPLSAGATLVLPPRQVLDSGKHLFAWLAHENITILHTVPTLTKHWMHSGTAETRLSALRLVFFAGEPLTGTLVKQWRKTVCSSATIVNLYGPTETTLAKLYYIVEDSPDDSVLPIGRPLPETQALVLSDHKTLCGIGEEGEIVLRTPFRTRGYINAPVEQARRFTPNPFLENADDLLYHTGDLGRYRHDGLIETLGRRDNQIQLRGIRIEPGEIEAALASHPAVRQAVVAMHEFSPGDQRLIAYLVCSSEESPGTSEIRQYLGELLPVAMMPAAFINLEEIPRTPSGKVNYQGLPTPTPGPIAADRDESASTPKDRLESQLLELWEKLFDRRPLGMTVDFFELGGSSLQAVQLFSEIEAMFGKNLPIATLFSASRLIDLANVIRKEGWLAPWSSLVPIRLEGTKPPLFYVHAGGGNLLIYRDSALRLGTEQPVYGLQPRGLDGILEPLRTVEEMASHYLALITKIQPSGPYYLAGLSSGGTVALEMAQRLGARGQEVALLAMFDTTGPQGYLPLPLLKRVCSVLGWYARDRFQEFLQFLRKCFRAAKNFDVRSVWRLALEHAGIAIKRLGPDQQKQREKAQDVLGKRLQIFRSERTAGIGKFIDTGLIFLLKNSSKPFFAGILAEGVAYPANEGGTERLRWIQEISDQASRTYAPKSYSGKIIYFQAIDSPPGVRPALLGGWAEMAIGGIELYRIPGDHTSIMKSPQLAQQLQNCLERAQSDSSKNP